MEEPIVASMVTVTELPGSRQVTVTVTSCPAVELLVEKAVPPAQVPPWVLETFTAPTVRFASIVSMSAISNAVAALLPVALLLNAKEYVMELPAKYGPAGEMDLVIDVIAGSATETETFAEAVPT